MNSSWTLAVGSVPYLQVLQDIIDNGSFVQGSASEEHYTVEYSGLSLTFDGTFAVNGGVVSGTFSGFHVYAGAILLFDTSGYSIDVAVVDAAMSGSTYEFYEALFSGSMTVIGSGSFDEVLGGPNADFLIVRGGNDEVYSGNGNDFISGGDGADTLNGEGGFDTADYSEKIDSVAVVLTNSAAPVDVLIGGIKEDTLASIENVRGGSGNDRLIGNGQVNHLVGNGADDVLAGVNGADTLLGGGGSDRLVGGEGYDLLNGGAGVDTLIGGRNSDKFVFSSKLGPGNVDVIRDFSHVADTMMLEHDIFTALGPGPLKSRFFHAGTAAGGGNDHVIYDQTTGALYYDRDGAGGVAQVRFAVLDHHPTVTAGDFLIC